MPYQRGYFFSQRIEWLPRAPAPPAAFAAQWRRHEREPPRPMNDREQQVRERAYYIWEAEGRPHGRAEIHWTMAEIATAVLSYLSLSEAEGATGMRVGNESE